MSSKYIIIKHGGVEVPILFSHLIGHNEMAIGKEIISAGFFATAAEPTEKDDKDIGVDVWGKSITIDKSCRKGQDESIIKEFLRKTY